MASGRASSGERMCWETESVLQCATAGMTSLRRCKILHGLLFFLQFLPVLTSTVPSLSLSSRLNVGDTLVSPSGHFEAGVFQFQNGNCYFGIRYAAPIEQVVVWVANRDIALSANSYLELSNPSGNLQLSDPNNDVTQTPWSSNTTSLGVGQAQLMDTGNLVLLDNNGKHLWESFTNSTVTDTLLPGQFFYKADNRNITSWLGKGDPGTGNGTYTFGWGTRANASVLQLAWTSPKVFMHWTGGPYVPATDVQNPETFTNVDFVFFHATEGNLYIPSSPANTVILSGGDAASATTLKRLTLDTDGGLRIWQWKVNSGQKTWTAVANWVVKERGSQCYAIGTCGAFSICQMNPPDSLDRVQCRCPPGFQPRYNDNDATRGCTPIVSLSGPDFCNASKVKLTALDGTDMPWGGDYRNLTGAASADCEAACLKDCNCSGAVLSTIEQYCWMKMTPLYNLGYLTVALHGNDRTAFVKVSIYQPPPADAESRHKKATVGVIIGASLGGVLVGVGILCLWKCKRRVCESCRKLCSCWEVQSNTNFDFPGKNNEPVRNLGLGAQA